MSKWIFFTITISRAAHCDMTRKKMYANLKVTNFFERAILIPKSPSPRKTCQIAASILGAGLFRNYVVAKSGIFDPPLSSFFIKK